MATRTLTGTILTPSGEPWEGFTLDFTVRPSQYTASAQFPEETVQVETEPDGTFSVGLEVGLAYTVGLRSAFVTSGTSTRYPSGTIFEITIPEGEGSIDLATVRGIDGISPSTPTIVDFAANHIDNTSNPHGTTAAQVGAYTQQEVDSLVSSVITVSADEPDSPQEHDLWLQL